MSDSPQRPRDAGRGTAVSLGLVERFQLALQRDGRAEVVDTVRELAAQRAQLGNQWFSLAMIVAQYGEVTLAREAFDLYFESFGGSAAAAYRKVDLLAQIGAWDEVLELLRDLPATMHKPPSYAFTRGTAALYMGEHDEARSYLEEAIRQHPRVGAPGLSLVLLVDFAQETDLADHIVASEAAMASATPVDRGNYYYTLGKVFADRGEHARAFAAYAQGAVLMKSQVDYSRERDRLSAAEALSGYDADRIAALASQQSEPTDRSIFVTGLPRSGTTLVEQILTSHSAVSEGAEIYRLGLLVKDIRGVSYSAVSRYAAEAGPPAAARLWRHWLDERFPAPGRVVDKTLNASRLLGPAAALLPEAPLIWLTRDPLDCAWSCFRTRFAGEAPWSYDLADLAFHMRLEDELLAHWQQILGDRLLVIPFDGLVTEPEPWTRRILAHCGLPEEPQVFTPHENRRLVMTSSVTQVRRPINRAGIGVAEPYRPYLEPFIRAYYG